MKKIFTLFLLIVISLSIDAQTQVSGEQSGTWAVANSPYEVTDSIIVPAGQTLIIESGVTVNFQGHHKFYVYGNLQALGTENDSIIFTADNHSTGWFGIHIETSDLPDFEYCKFEYGITSGDNYPAMHGGAIRLIDSDATFKNCVFSDNSSQPSEGMGGAIYGINTSSGGSSESTTFTDCKFIDNVGYTEGGAIKFTSDLGTVFLRCEFISNSTSYGGGAVMGYSVEGTTFTKCLFVDNSSAYANGGAIETLGSGNTMYFKNCTFYNNDAVNGSGGAAAFYYAAVDFVNCIVKNNTSQYDDDNIYVDAGGGSATINYSNLIMPDYNTTGSDNINVDPLFVDANNGDFHLQETSPCVDAGTDIGLPFEGTAPDMGCYEYGFVEAPYVISFVPNQNAIDVEFDATVSVIFNEDVSVVDLSGIEIKDASSVSVSGVSAVLEADNRTITISHDDFAENMLFTVTIPENSVQNTDDVQNEEIIWSFTTKNADNISKENSNINIFPNPTSGIFTVNNAKNYVISIIDISGKIIKTQYVSDYHQNFDISNLENGIYFLKIQTDNEIISRKIIKK